MNFKEQVARDLDTTFFNLEEFAEKHLINGVLLSVIIAEDETSERERQPVELYNAANGVNKASMTIYIRAFLLEDRPVVGGHFDVDGAFYQVVACADVEGMYKIDLEVNDA